MRAGERMVASDGYEVMLFPLEYMNASQEEGGGYSHAGTLQMDFLGWGASGRIEHCPYYAPCTCTCVGISDYSTNNRIYQSVDKVHLADGTLGIVTFECAHDNFPVHSIGDRIIQGQILGRTGTAGYVTGDHLHFQCARGAYAGWEQVPPNNNWQLVNEMHIYDACYVNETIIINGYNYNWREYQGGVTPEEKAKRRRKYPWQIYARQFRRRRGLNGT